MISRYGNQLAIIFAGMCLGLVFAMSMSNIAYGKEPKLYTAYNIWLVGVNDQKFINFKYGQEFIPAGTEVKSVYLWTSPGGGEDPNLVFTRVDNNKSYKIYYDSRYHPGKSPDYYKNVTVTPKSLDELTKGFTECELFAIKKGSVVDGMRREAVLVSYGYPPEHATSSQSINVWAYWTDRTHKQLVKFDDKGLTIDTGTVLPCSKRESVDPSASGTSNQESVSINKTGRDKTVSVNSVTAAPVVLSRSASDIMERIKVLGELKSQGIISVEEYEAKRKELLGQL